MKKLTEKNLIELGFEKVDVSPEESGGDAYFYFIYGGHNGISLISNESNEYDEYYIEFFNYPEHGQYYKYDQIKNLIEILKSGVK